MTRTAPGNLPKLSCWGAQKRMTVVMIVEWQRRDLLEPEVTSLKRRLYLFPTSTEVFHPQPQTEKLCLKNNRVQPASPSSLLLLPCLSPSHSAQTNGPLLWPSPSSFLYYPPCCSICALSSPEQKDFLGTLLPPYLQH